MNRETSSRQIREAILQLRSSDKIMKGVIDDVGEFTLRVERNRFFMIVRSIIGQQISVTAARTIQARLEHLVSPEGVSAGAFSKLHDRELRRAGLSAQKAAYIRDLAHHVVSGKLNLNVIGRYSDDAVVNQLIQVKGIGTWTAHMFLIFGLGRLDVLPVGDMGLRTAVRRRYGLDELPGEAALIELAEAWRPYASIATWYCWRGLDKDRERESAKQ
jgi:DNA-3-methyladenine glycosylase II